MIVVIDNYDSFTYNLVQHLGRLGAELTVFRNDQVTVEEIKALHPSHIVISPGPGTPDDAGVSNEVIRQFAGKIPILGICLGHQCIGQVFGGRIVQAPHLMHGKTSLIRHADHPLFEGVPNPFEATRYHSLVVEEPLPGELEPIAFTLEGELMGLRHREHLVFGLQFHPESILTGEGLTILRNFLNLTGTQSTGPASTFDERSFDIKVALARILEGKNLTAEEAEAVMSQIMNGQATPAQIGAFLVAMRMKGETVEEIAGCARAMRAQARRIYPRRAGLVDTCGTGGDGYGTFNISTTAAFVVAGAGLPVAKHGNRSVSSRCGSADVLEALGVNLSLTPEQVARCVDEIGIGFLFAPQFHPAMKHAIGPRREIGVRTLFNILGPLTNPAGASAQVLGVYAPSLTEPLAHVLSDLGTRAAFVVHSDDGLDELSTTGSNRASYLAEGRVTNLILNPEDLGLRRARLSDLRGGDAAENAQIMRRVLAGEEGPRRDVTLLNAAAALVAGGAAATLREGLRVAADSIDSGAARARLEDLIRFSQQCST